ncbi:hypothetical protein HOY80DRAFT_1037101 [Tuber brumale]|nr:hypothetical protein HOY80DRAFT_1037101 [Tuber brumale]
MTDAQALKEVNIHRGKSSHTVIVEVFVDGHFLPRLCMIIATPTGSRVYSLSSVLPAEYVLTLNLSAKNRVRYVEVKVNSRPQSRIGRGKEVRVWVENIEGEKGGIPCLKVGIWGRDDGWVGGLNRLTKFNCPFGEVE